MEITQIETFLAVASFGGFHRAAEALRISQPAVSSRIKALEESLGVPLSCVPAIPSRFECRTSTASLRRTVVEDRSMARQAVHQLTPAATFRCRSPPGFRYPYTFCPTYCKKFQIGIPEVNISIRPGHSKEVLEMVLGEEAEMVLPVPLQHPEVETIACATIHSAWSRHPEQLPNKVGSSPGWVEVAAGR